MAASRTSRYCAYARTHSEPVSQRSASVSCTPQSRNCEPSAGSNAQSLRGMITRPVASSTMSSSRNDVHVPCISIIRMSPMRPSSTSCFMAIGASRNRVTKLTVSCTPAARHASMIASHSATESAIGFSM